MLIGLFLVLIGLVWLLSNLDLISATVAQVIWPIILIVLGLSLLVKRDHYFKSWCCGRMSEDKKE